VDDPHQRASGLTHPTGLQGPGVREVGWFRESPASVPSVVSSGGGSEALRVFQQVVHLLHVWPVRSACKHQGAEGGGRGRGTPPCSWAAGQLRDLNFEAAVLSFLVAKGFNVMSRRTRR
jgi:hypothetical protein